MARYDDPLVFFDSGVLYDEPDLPQPKRKTMAKPKLSLNRLNPDQILALANQIVTAMTGNANFTTPNPPLATISGRITTATTKVAAQKAAQLAARQTRMTETRSCWICAGTSRRWRLMWKAPARATR